MLDYGPEFFLKMPHAWDGCGGMWRTQQSSCDGEEEGQWEMVAGSSGMSHPHPAVRVTAKRQFIAASCVPQAGVGGNLLNNKIVKYCFDLFFSIIC